MIRFIYASQLAQYPVLADSMFRDRATQFRDRLGWPVNVDQNGHERDEYDGMNPLYLVWERADGTHGGSMRVLPTIGRTMVNDHFRHLNGGIAIRHTHVWECTRFCLAPEGADIIHVAWALMLAGQELGLRLGLREAVGVYDYRMTRVYRRLGWEPRRINRRDETGDDICLGSWQFGTHIRDEIARRAGLRADAAAAWFDASFPENAAPMAA